MEPHGSGPPRDLAMRIALAVAATLALLAFWGFGMVHRQAPRFEPPAQPAPASEAPRFHERFASNSETREVHSATAYADGGTMTAFWYGGTREGARDVAIYQARLVGDTWGKPKPVVQRKQMKSELNRHVRKIGNPIVYRHPDGRLWLFFVTVSVGGWAGSSISLAESTDNGETWSRARRLVTSPFFNLSTLVKGSAFRYADGTIGLPVYHEFIGKFGEMLRIDGDGRILGKTRFTSGRHALQPEIAVLGPERAVGVLRYAGEAPRRVLHMLSDDAGRTWSEPQKIHLPNPDSAVEVMAFGEDRLLGVLNDIEEARWRLVLVVSDNLGKDWRTVKVLEQQQDAADVNRYQFSYPWMLRTNDGDFHVLYTWNRTRIKHIEFNQSWLEQAADAVAVPPTADGKR
jgi:predicted neuraminidase